jgi:hypothetical protein
VCPEKEFVFTQAGRPTGRRARSVRDLLSTLPALPDDVVQGHLMRGDFRRWIEEVFGDSELGAAILPLEREHGSDVRDALLHAIVDRYGESPT